MLLILIHYGKTNWLFLTVKIQYMMVAWILHVEFRGPVNDRYI